ncbi:hypothetical protein JDV02_010014 [Purpureocillium takamizusanense]|uniref:NADH:flavin oxidoreductase/NADH oxidase N-terminal domain-containing protein n=1 Tax=Purpureocillium takamizusanense TaxID=2060973 RepID=A0A9Q8QS41_9HYPO|nr:uncharacterized protein JDV02_010014 [Purpureocillium takamizusanense]UNI24251.1 hypothetical protein JDV02_010014 [Purpureocillium takamizusanense]
MGKETEEKKTTSGLDMAKPMTLPCGLTIPNRLTKAAMAEAWADRDRLPSERMLDAYGVWADGGWGMVLTGNVQVDVAYLGTPDDTALNHLIPREQLLDAWRRWAQTAGGDNGNGNGNDEVETATTTTTTTTATTTITIMQINHPGRQSIIGAGTRSLCAKSIAPSAVPLLLGQGIVPRAISALVFGTPRAMSVDEIRHVVARFADSARLAAEAGFSGVQIHGAHGYLVAQFLSARSNLRTDQYGGSPRRRARFLVEIIEAVREAVPKTGFAVGLKFNSVDHQSPRELDECIEQLEDITAAGIDFLEISGGTYEDPTMMANAPPKAASTVAREAFFLDFAKAIRQRFRNVPLMVTGGFRSRQGMEAALRDDACDMIGLGRPAVLNPHLPVNTLLNPEVADADANVYARTVPGSWLLKQLGIKGIAGGAETAWYQRQIHNMLSGIL